MKVKFQAKIAQCNKTSKESPDLCTTIKLLADNLDSAANAYIIALMDTTKNASRELTVVISDEEEEQNDGGVSHLAYERIPGCPEAETQEVLG